MPARLIRSELLSKFDVARFSALRHIWGCLRRSLRLTDPASWV